ncbi:MAG: tetratricopeptide repeat protein [Sphingomonadales bacterium]
MMKYGAWMGSVAAAAMALAVGSCQQAMQGAGFDAADYETGLHHYVAGQRAWLERDTAVAADYYLAALASDPDNAILRQRAFQILVSDGRFAEAMPLAQSLKPGSAAYGVARMLLALDALKARDYDDALTALDDVAGTGFDSLLRPLTRAWALVGAGRVDDGLAALDVLDSMPPLASFGREHRALILMVAGRWDEAEPMLRAMVDSRSASVRTIHDYAAHLSQTGDMAAALAALEPWVEGNPRLATLRADRDRLRAGKPLETLVDGPVDAVAEALFRTATELMRQPTSASAIIYARLATFLRPQFADALVLIGDMLEMQSRPAAALAAYRAVPANHILAKHARLRGSLMLDQLERSDEAIADLKALLAEDPHFADAEITLAGILRRLERYGDAIVHYDRAIAMAEAAGEADWTLFYGRGISHERLGAWDRAEADFRTALELNPDEPYVLNYLGYSLLDRGLKLDEATAMIERAVAQRPDDGFIVDSLGWAHYLAGRYQQAVEQLEKAVSLQPADPTINDHLGDAYWKAGRTLEARFKWRHALQMEPEPEHAARIREKLDLGLTLVERAQ